MNTKSSLFLALAALALSGCGGGGSSSPAAPATGRGAIKLSVEWPTAGRFIPLNARYITVTVRNAATPLVPLDRVVFVRGQVLTGTKPVNGLEAGDYVLVARAYRNDPGDDEATPPPRSEAPLSIGQVTVKVVADQTTTARLSMQSQFSSLRVESGNNYAHEFPRKPVLTAPTLRIPLPGAALTRLSITPGSAEGDLLLFPLTSPASLKVTGPTGVIIAGVVDPNAATQEFTVEAATGSSGQRGVLTITYTDASGESGTFEIPYEVAV